MTGFPGLGVLRRLRPTRSPQPTVDLSQPRQLACADDWDDQWVVPVFTAVHSIEEEPDSAPAASPLPTPQTFSTTSPKQGSTNPEKFPSLTTRDAPLPAQIRQVRAGQALRGYTTSVPHALLSIHAYRAPRHLAVLTHPGFVGLLPPSPTPSGTGCPQLRQAAATARRCRSFTSTQNSSASRRTKPALNAFAITFADRMPTKAN
jgi:hypothetical protein